MAYRPDCACAAALCHAAGLILTVVSAIAPLPACSQVSMGARTGMNISTVTNTDVDAGTTRMAVGPGGGFVLHVFLTDIFAINQELLFNARGISASVGYSDYSQRATKRLYYLDLPFMIRAYYNFKKLRLYGGTGPQLSVGLFVQDVVRIKGEHYRSKLSETSAFSDQTRRYEIAWDFDAGIGIPLKDRSELEFNVRPALGLINIAKEEFNVSDNRNFMVSFSAAYIFKR